MKKLNLIWISILILIILSSFAFAYSIDPNDYLIYNLSVTTATSGVVSTLPSHETVYTCLLNITDFDVDTNFHIDLYDASGFIIGVQALGDSNDKWRILFEGGAGGDLGNPLTADFDMQWEVNEDTGFVRMLLWNDVITLKSNLTQEVVGLNTITNMATDITPGDTLSYWAICWNGTIENRPTAGDDTPTPTVVLISPEDNNENDTATLAYTYNVTFYDEETNCHLYINTTGTWTNEGSNSTALNNGSSSTISKTLNNGNYIWNVNCSNGTVETWGASNYTITINVTVPQIPAPTVLLYSPENNSISNNLTQDFHYNASTEYALTNISLYIDGIYNRSNTSAVTNNANSSFSQMNFTDGIHHWSIKALDNNSNETMSNNFTIIIDTSSPQITSNIEGSIVIKKETTANAKYNFSGWINFTDDNLYSITINDTTTGTILNVTSISTTTYNFSLELNITDYINGNHTLYVTAWDGHTDTKIEEWKNSKNYFTKKITFDFSNTLVKNKFLSVNPLDSNLLTSFEIEKLKDRYIYKLKKDAETREVSFEVESSDYIDIINRPNHKYKAWLVNPSLKKWTDFNIKDPTRKEIYKTERINDNRVRVTISNLDKRELIIFESTGNLNSNSKSYNWTLATFTEGQTSKSSVMEQSLFITELVINKTFDMTSNATFYFNDTLNYTSVDSSIKIDIYNGSELIPRIGTGTLNISYGWYMTLDNGVKTGFYNSTYNETFYAFSLTNCSEINPVKAMNFSIFDESESITEDVPLSNYSYIGVFRISPKSNPTYQKNYSQAYSVNGSSNAICLIPNTSETFDVTYQISFSKTDYTSKLLTELSGYLNRTTQTINVYMIPTASTSTITVKLIDEVDNELEGYVVEVWKYNLFTDTYTLIDTETADSEGECNFDVDISNNKEYKFIVKNTDGDIVYTQSKQKIIQTEYTFIVILGTTQELTTLKIQALNIKLIKSRISKSFNVTWNDISVNADMIIFSIKNQTDTTETLYNINSSADSGEFGYTLSQPLTNVSSLYIASVFVVASDDGETYFYDSESLDFREEYDLFGVESLFSAFILFCGMFLIGLAGGGEIAIILSIVALIVSYKIGLVMISLTSIISLIVAFMIFLWQLSRRQQ